MPRHQYGVQCIHGKGTDGLKDVSDGGCAGTRIPIIIRHVRKQATNARPVPVLHKYVPVIAIAADSREYHGNARITEEPTGCDPRGIAVHTADGDVARQGGVLLNGFLQPKCIAANIRRG